MPGPNGIALSPDQSKLYVALQAQGRIISYDVTAPGVVANGSIYATPGVAGPDGMTIDGAGNLYGAVQNAVFAWNPAGEKLFEIPVPQNPTNVEFGPDGDTLFITAGSGLYRIMLDVPDPVAGDFDNDGDVDGRDFLVWQRGNSPMPLSAENLALWQSEYAGGALAATIALPVPEPMGWLMLLVGSGVLDPRRWRD